MNDQTLDLSEVRLHTLADMAAVLGAMFEARIHDKLRAKGATYTLSAPVVDSDLLHAIIVTVPLHPDKVVDGDAIVTSDLDAIRTGQFSDDEVLQARAMALSNSSAVDQDPALYAARLSRDPSFDEARWGDALNAVQPSELRAWTLSTLKAENLIRVTFSRARWIAEMQKRAQRRRR